jgi:deferrochelatase/peroxidase EfeB
LLGHMASTGTGRAVLTDSPGGSVAPTAEDERDIQGGLIGFNKDHQRIVFARFADAASGRAFLLDMVPLLASAWEVRQFNALFKEVNALRGGPEGVIRATWTNLWLTVQGLQLLGANAVDSLPEEFRRGMTARAALIGDVGRSAPDVWLPPFGGSGGDLHAAVVIAADQPADREAGYARVAEIMGRHGVAELAPAQDGDVRPEPNRGREHFGFKDGISQPGIAGMTASSKGGRPVAAGEFLIGYPDEAGTVSGQPPTEPPPPPSPYDPSPPVPIAAPLPAWMHNASFVVYRRLRQDVGSFLAAMQEQSVPAGLSADQLGAKLAGRWPSGAPLARVPGERPDLDTTTTDPSLTNPRVLDDAHINSFGYQADRMGSSHPAPLTSARATRATASYRTVMSVIATECSAAASPTDPSSSPPKALTGQSSRTTPTAGCCSCHTKRPSPVPLSSSRRVGRTPLTSCSPGTERIRSSARTRRHDRSASPRICR